jgi:hypothetical protein
MRQTEQAIGRVNLFVPDHSFDNLITKYDDCTRAFVQHNGERPDITFVDNPGDADIIVLFEEFSFKQFNYIKKLGASPLFSKYAAKIYTINRDDISRSFLPGCYTSLRPSNFDKRYHRACTYPCIYNAYATTSNNSSITPRYLYSFRGTTTSHPSRIRICSLLSKNELGSVSEVLQRFHSHDDSQKKGYVDEILLSKFVLCPRGWSPSTYRLFEVMSLGRCPVVISDEWIPPDGISWDSCSIRIAEHSIKDIPEILSGYSSQWQVLGSEASKVWLQHFSEKARYQGYLDKILDLYFSHKRLKIKGHLEAQAYFMRWSSWDFRWKNGWTFPQKISRRLSAAHGKLRQRTSCLGR